MQGLKKILMNSKAQNVYIIYLSSLLSFHVSYILLIDKQNDQPMQWDIEPDGCSVSMKQ